MSHVITVQAQSACAATNRQPTQSRTTESVARTKEPLAPLLEEPDSTRRAARLVADARQRSLANQHAAAEDFAEFLALAYLTFTDFCRLACTVIRDRRERAALNVEGKPPVDAVAFVRTARSTYRMALQTPSMGQLAACGYDSATLNGALQTLEQLASARQDLVQATARATELGVVYATGATGRGLLRTHRTNGHRLPVGA